MVGDWKPHYLRRQPSEEEVSLAAERIREWMEFRSRGYVPAVTKSGVASSVVEEYLTSHQAQRQDFWALRLGVELLIEGGVLVKECRMGRLYLATAYLPIRKPRLPTPAKKAAQESPLASMVL